MTYGGRRGSRRRTGVRVAAGRNGFVKPNFLILGGDTDDGEGGGKDKKGNNLFKLRGKMRQRETGRSFWFREVVSRDNV